MRLTRRGRLVATAGTISWAAALISGNVAAAMGAALLTAAMAIGIATLPSPRIDSRRMLARDRFTEGERVREDLEIRLASKLPVRVTVEETTSPGLKAAAPGPLDLALAPGKPVSLKLEFEATTWGRQRLGPLRIVVQDPWGLVESEAKALGELQLRVRPRAHPLGKFRPRAGNPEPALGAHNVTKPGDGFEFFALRGYQAGDSIRRINWKASARSSETIVNQVSRDSFSRVVVFVDLRDKETLGSHEGSACVRNGRAAASILAQHERMRDHLSLVAVHEDVSSLSISPNPRLSDLVDALADRTPQGSASFRHAVMKNVTAIRPRSPVYFVTSAALDAELGAAISLVAALGAHPYVISPRPEGEEIDLETTIAASRELALREARSLGAVVVDWAPTASLELSILAA